MKKIALVLVLLMVFGLVQTFAQTAPALSFSGAVYAWQNYSAPDDLWAGRQRFRLNMAYTDGGYGVRARYQVSNTEYIGGEDLNVGYAYAWVTLFDGFLKVSAGKAVPYSYGAWSTIVENHYYVGPLNVGVKDDIIFPGFDGAALTVTPMKDLEIFVGVPIGLGVSSGAATTPVVGDAIDALKLGVKFNLPDLLTIWAYYDMGQNFAVTASVGAVENLTAAVKYEMTSAESAVGAALSYNLADLGLTIANDLGYTFTAGDFTDDFAVTYAQDAWDVMVGLAWNADPYIFLYFNAYVGKYTFDPYVTVSFAGDFAVTLMHTFAF